MLRSASRAGSLGNPAEIGSFLRCPQCGRPLKLKSLVSGGREVSSKVAFARATWRCATQPPAANWAIKYHRSPADGAWLDATSLLDAGGEAVVVNQRDVRATRDEPAATPPGRLTPQTTRRPRPRHHSHRWRRRARPLVLATGGDTLLSRSPLTIGLMSSQPEGVVIDAALRFARSNPDLLRYAQSHAGRAGRSADDLLREAIERVAASRRFETSSWSMALQLPPDSPQESGAGTIRLSHAGSLSASVRAE
jgi:hypothetical protein